MTVDMRHRGLKRERLEEVANEIRIHDSVIFCSYFADLSAFPGQNLRWRGQSFFPHSVLQYLSSRQHPERFGLAISARQRRHLAFSAFLEEITSGAFKQTPRCLSSPFSASAQTCEHT